ncbi:MAG TPA: hypothetical protein VFA56_07585 [Gaiellaceae bacterium]|nr:hypothetical protein [Gaiellaceae bacterium]
MLEVGDKAPLAAEIWTTPRERATVGDLLHGAASPVGEAAGARPEHPAYGGGRPLLLLFYLFDWSST